jgi:hypothetical protein
MNPPIMMKVHKVRTKTLLPFLAALSASGFATGFEELEAGSLSVLGCLELDSEG